LPYISDTSENLHLMFSEFKEVGSKYVFPATLTLFGEGRHDSKTLVLRAVRDNYPHLLEKYERFFRHSTQMPHFYRDGFYSRMSELLKLYGLKDRI
jgi:hypothetical protein